MTLNEFNALLKNDPVLQQKFIVAVDATKDHTKDARTEEDLIANGVVFSKIIQDLGCDVSADEIAQEFINIRKLDEEELEAFSGGAADYTTFLERYGDQSTSHVLLKIHYTVFGEPCHYTYHMTDSHPMWPYNVEEFAKQLVAGFEYMAGPNALGAYQFTGIEVQPFYEFDFEAQIKKIFG